MRRRSHRPRPSHATFLRHLSRNALTGLGMIAVSLAIGCVGYRVFAGLPWIDSLLNASMILTGMGPVDPMATSKAKLFASFYAIFSGVAFLTIMSVVLAPLVHRFLHRFHLELDDTTSDAPGKKPPGVS